MTGPDKITQLRALSLRKKETFTEKRLWKMLRNRSYNNLKFRRQHPIPPYIADFYCHELKLVIELDGFSHNDSDQIEYDKRRDKYMRNEGLTIIRITNVDFIEKPSMLFDQIDGLAERIRSSKE